MQRPWTHGIIAVMPILHRWDHPEDIPSLDPVADGVAVLSGPMEAAVIKRRAKSLSSKPLRGEKGWKMVQGGVAVVRGDIPVADLRMAAVYAEELQVMLRAYLGGESARPLYSIRLFKDPVKFRNLARMQLASNAESYYNPQNSEIVMSFGIYATLEDFQRSFAHEFTHAYIDRVWHKLNPLWMQEGMAEWFSNVTWRAGILVPGQPNVQSLHILKEIRSELSLKFMSEGRDEFYGYRFREYYAQTWSFIDYVATQFPHGALADVISGKFGILSHEEAWRDHVDRMLL